MRAAADAGRPCSWAARRPLSFNVTAHLRAAWASPSSASSRRRRNSAAGMPAPLLSWIVASLAETIVERSVHSEDSRPSLMTMSLAHLWMFTLQDPMTSSVMIFFILKFASKMPVPPM
ncbi:MAG: hypothetical protein ACK559_28180, partial [bacterium]